MPRVVKEVCRVGFFYIRYSLPSARRRRSPLRFAYTPAMPSPARSARISPPPGSSLCCDPPRFSTAPLRHPSTTHPHPRLHTIYGLSFHKECALLTSVSIVSLFNKVFSILHVCVLLGPYLVLCTHTRQCHMGRVPCIHHHTKCTIPLMAK